VRRAIEKNPNVMEVFLLELDKAKNRIEQYDHELTTFKQALTTQISNEYALRQQVEKMALLWQASTLIQYSEEYTAEAFVLSRISCDHGYMYGTLPEYLPFRDIIDRAKPSI
ncbi:MAG: DNA alkylation response protein, partial [Candidatus Thiodiazotropha sp. (ex Lucinoma borealis)]|nr:DNA alkylation response protein [Candidatus Thiodiazotropha sp. (ex Lucinoma borealis)]